MKNYLLTGAAVIAASMAIAVPASAQTTDCECINGVKVVIIGGVPTPTNIPCEGSFNVTPPIPQAGPVPPTTAIPVVISSTINDPRLGTVTIRLDNNRPAPPTRISSNSPASRYPLTVELNFNATATTDGGTVYENVQTFTYVTQNAQSINPFNGEVLTLQNDVDFVPAGGGDVAFTIQAGSSFLNLGPKTVH